MKAVLISILIIVFAIVGSIVSGDGAPIVFMLPIGIYLLIESIKYGNDVLNPHFFD